MNNVYRAEDKTDPKQVLTSSEKLAKRHIPLYMRQKTKIVTDTIAYGKIQATYGFKYLSGIELKTQSNRNHSARKYAEQTAIKSYIAINKAIICQCSTCPIQRFAFFSSVSKELPLRPLYSKHLCIMSITTSCCSGVILLSEGRHNPRLNKSAPTSSPEPFIYALDLPRPFPSAVTNL